MTELEKQFTIALQKYAENPVIEYSCMAVQCAGGRGLHDLYERVMYTEMCESVVCPGTWYPAIRIKDVVCDELDGGYNMRCFLLAMMVACCEDFKDLLEGQT